MTENSLSDTDILKLKLCFQVAKNSTTFTNKTFFRFNNESDLIFATLSLFDGEN